MWIQLWMRSISCLTSSSWQASGTVYFTGTGKSSNKQIQAAGSLRKSQERFELVAIKHHPSIHQIQAAGCKLELRHSLLHWNQQIKHHPSIHQIQAAGSLRKLVLRHSLLHWNRQIKHHPSIHQIQAAGSLRKLVVRNGLLHWNRQVKHIPASTKFKQLDLSAS